METVNTDDRGSILLLSLWILAFLGMIAASLTFRMGMALRLTQHQWDQIRLRQSAKEAVAIVAKSPQTPLYQRGESFPLWKKGKEGDLPGGMLVSIEDESGKINLNAASRDVLERLFGLHAQVVPAILAWRTPARASAGDYDRLGYAARQGALQTLEELLLVKGMTPEIFQQVRDHLTVYSEGPVNINTASPEVLRALGLPEPLVQKIIFFRKGPDDAEGTTDDGVFTQQAMIIPLLKNKTILSEADLQALSRLVGQNRLSVQADRYRLQIRAQLPNSRLVGRYTVVMSARSKPGQLLYWREF